MSKPAVFANLAAGKLYQFATGREDTMQIQHLEALSLPGSVNLFFGTTGTIALGDGSASDLVFGSRGSTLTFNQAGNESLVGFAPTVTSLVAAINDVKSAVGSAGLQGAYNIVNTIGMTTGRDVLITTFDGVGPSNFIIRNSGDFRFIQTDTVNSEIKLGDGTNLYVNFPGQVDSDIQFDNTLSKLHADSSWCYHRDLFMEGLVTGDPTLPVSLNIRGKVNGANTAGSNVWVVAERNTAGTPYGGNLYLDTMDGPMTGTGWRCGLDMYADDGLGNNRAWTTYYANYGEVWISGYKFPVDHNTPALYLWGDNAPISIFHEGNATWEIGGGGGTTTFTDAYGRIYFYIDDYTAGGRVALGTNVWPVAGHGTGFRNLIGTVTNVGIGIPYQADVALLANTRAGGPDRAGLCVWNADPNGVCFAPRGSLLLRTDNGTAYLNNNDAAAWTPVGLGVDTLQAAYDAYTGGAQHIALDDLGKDLIIETKDTATFRNFILRKANDSVYLRTDAQNSNLIIGNTVGPTSVGVLLDSNLSWVRDNNDRSIDLYNESLAQKRTLTIEATRGVANQYGGDLRLWADGSVAHPDATGGGQVEIASKLGGTTRSYIQLNQNGDLINYGAVVNSYGRMDVVIDAGSVAGTPLNISNSRGPTTVTATGGTFTVNATGQSATLDCSALDIDATSASHIASSATLLVSAANDLTFGARGATITLNQLGDENLDPGFTATSIIGALNQLLSGGGAGTLQQAYNLGNTIGMATARPIVFTTWDAAGPSNFIVQNSLGRLFLQTDTSASSIRLGDTLLNDIVLSGRGASLTFNQAGNTTLVGFNLATTSIVAALNELKATPVASTLQQAYNNGNTIGLTAARQLTFTTWDGAGGLSDFVVQNAIGSTFIQTQTVLGSATGSIKIGDVALTDVIIAGRGASLTFNQVGNTALVGFNPATTSIVAALNELKASPSGGVTATYTTAEAVVVGDALYMTAAGTVGIADYTTVSGKDDVIGFSTQSVGGGVPCVVALAGEVSVKSTLGAGDLGKSAFLDATGNVTATAPGASGLSYARVGLITASGAGTSKIVVQIDEAIVL